MADSPFQVDNRYTRSDIYEILDVPSSQQHGKWDTGYCEHNGEWYIFCYLGGTGIYDNKLEGDVLKWYGRTQTTISSNQIRSLIKPDNIVNIYTRMKPRTPFIFRGHGRFLRADKNSSPVQIDWLLIDPSEPENAQLLPDEVDAGKVHVEGAVTRITVNAYERNPQARRDCIEHYGTSCSVCEFNFGDGFGELGEGYIHVHHIKPLHTIGESYEVDPIADLRPVCPNCHAMLHRDQKKMLSIAELRELWQRGR